MDTNVEKQDTLLILFEAMVSSEEAKLRLVDSHGFEVDVDRPVIGEGFDRLIKRSQATYFDAVTYARTLYSIPGTVQVQVLIDTERPAEKVDAQI